MNIATIAIIIEVELEEEVEVEVAIVVVIVNSRGVARNPSIYLSIYLSMLYIYLIYLPIYLSGVLLDQSNNLAIDTTIRVISPSEVQVGIVSLNILMDDR